MDVELPIGTVGSSREDGKLGNLAQNHRSAIELSVNKMHQRWAEDGYAIC
jgi:hypothetical protein